MVRPGARIGKPPFVVSMILQLPFDKGLTANPLAIFMEQCNLFAAFCQFIFCRDAGSFECPEQYFIPRTKLLLALGA